MTRQKIPKMFFLFLVFFSLIIPLSLASAEKSDTFPLQSHPPEDTHMSQSTGVPLLFKPFISGIISDYPKHEQIFSVSGLKGGGASPASSYFYTLLPWQERNQQPPFEQYLIRSALGLSDSEGINPLHIIEYNISGYPNPPERYVYEVGFSLGTEKISPEDQNGTRSYHFNSDGNVTQTSRMSFSLVPGGEVILESPYAAYQDPVMQIASIKQEFRPLFIYNVSLGYYLHKRPYNRGEFYEPAWIFYGVNRKSEVVTEWVWASKDRGTYPLRNDLNSASAKKIVLHKNGLQQCSLAKDDVQFAVIEKELKEILHEITAQCSCFLTPKQKEEQIQNGSYVEVIFSDRTNVAFRLMEDPGPYNLVESQIDGVLIAFDGPFGEMIYPYEYSSDTDTVIWGMWFSRRNLSYLKDLSNLANC